MESKITMSTIPRLSRAHIDQDQADGMLQAGKSARIQDIWRSPLNSRAASRAYDRARSARPRGTIAAQDGATA